VSTPLRAVTATVACRYNTVACRCRSPKWRVSTSSGRRGFLAARDVGAFPASGISLPSVGERLRPSAIDPAWAGHRITVKGLLWVDAVEKGLVILSQE